MSETSNVARGTEYERFVQAVYQSLVEAEGIDNINVAHNITLKGNSGCEHQIDVYWEFRLAGQTYRTAIECKAFDKAVPVGRVRDFYGVLVDVPGLMGVFATLVGYQSGAKLFAKHYGISLKELRAPTDADWQGRVRDITIRAHVVMPQITAFDIRPSKAFLATIPKGGEVAINTGFASDEPIIFDATGTPVATYEDLRRSLPTDRETATGSKFFADFPKHRFRSGSADVEIDGVDITYDVQVDVSETTMRGDDLAHAIVKDVASGELNFVRRDRKTTHHP